MLMQSKKRQAEIEKAHVKSLALIAGTFLVANVLLFFGLTAVASAQTIQAASPAFDLAKMLAAPDISGSFELGSMQMGAAATMIAGLVAMASGSVFFLRNFAHDLNAASRSKL